MFVRSVITAAQRGLAVTTAYAPLKFELQGCATDNAIANEPKPPHNKVQVIAEPWLAGYKPPTALETTNHGMQTKDPLLCIPAPHEFTQRILNYLADNTDDPDINIEKLYAKTYAEHPHDAGLRCFPPTIAQFDPCHKAMWSAAYNAAVDLKVLKENTLELQAHVRRMQSSLYSAHVMANIAKHHATLINNNAMITTLQSSAWNLWDAILTGAGFRQPGYSLAHALVLMARSSHPNRVAKICCNAPCCGGHYIADNNFAPVMIHLAKLLIPATHG
jgi:hypothetical protein